MPWEEKLGAFLVAVPPLSTCPSATHGVQGWQQGHYKSSLCLLVLSSQGLIHSMLRCRAPSHVAQVGWSLQGSPLSCGPPFCQGNVLFVALNDELCIQGHTWAHFRAPKLGITGSPGTLPQGLLCLGVTVDNLQSSPGRESLKNSLFIVRSVSEKLKIISN